MTTWFCDSDSRFYGVSVAKRTLVEPQYAKHVPWPVWLSGEVSAGVLTFEGKSYMLVVGEAPIESNNTATLIYDFAEDTWLIGSSREFAGNHHASEVIDNKMYLFGGLTTGNHTIQIASLVQAPQGVDVQWSFGADLPVPSGSAATALIDGQVSDWNIVIVPCIFTDSDISTMYYSCELVLFITVAWVLECCCWRPSLYKSPEVCCHVRMAAGVLLWWHRRRQYIHLRHVLLV